jgi:hypothetical protein
MAATIQFVFSLSFIKKKIVIETHKDTILSAV